MILNLNLKSLNISILVYISYIVYLILDNVLSQTLPTLWPNGTFKVSFSPEEALKGWDKSAWAWENRGS